MTNTNDRSVNSDTQIAVIGLDCVFPQAPDARSFWQNIVNGVNAIGDPLEEWNSSVHLTRRKDTSTDQGGYLKDLFRFEPGKFGIMPNALDGGEPDQYIALDLAQRALADAGEKYTDPAFDHRDTGVIIGHSPYYHRGQVNTAQHHIFLEQMREMLLALKPDISAKDLAEFETLLRDQLPPFVADISPGLVPNVLTGRIANRLNLRGPNYMIDAACASSLIAVQAGVDELMRGNCRMMLVGGVNASLPAEVAIIFTQLGALSDSGQVRPFSESADGTLLGEGAGVVVLKRLEDAIEDGDRIYSVIRGVGQSSDGRGLGLLSPSMDGEVLAMRRAYESSGIDPSTVGLVECHGTGIPLGDRTEIGALRQIFGARAADEGQVAIGSVKSMISHCIPAAGVAGLIKTSLALHHQLLPPTICDSVKPDLGIDETNLYVNTTPRPWIHAGDAPRRAGVNAFGFGGVNAHVILEQAPPVQVPREKFTPWSHELFVFAAPDVSALNAQLATTAAFAQAREDVKLCDVAWSTWQVARDNGGPVRLSIVAGSHAELCKKIAQAQKKIAKSDKPFTIRTGVSFRTAPLDGKLAFMFAGEGSQYLGMLDDLAARFEPARRWLDFWKRSTADLNEKDRTDVFYPRQSELTETKEDQLQADVFSMAMGSEAAFIGGQAMFDLLTSLGVTPDTMVGHSTGESGALLAAGVLKTQDPATQLKQFHEITSLSRDVFDRGDVPTGTLLAVGLLDRDQILAAIADTDAVIAMENCPTQTIVFVPGDGGPAVLDTLAAQGATVEALPFDRGYHTAGFAPMEKAFKAFYRKAKVTAPKVPLYSCATAAPFGTKSTEIVTLAGQQWSNKVRFVDTIKAMYDDGVRAFIEVAPGGKLAAFTQQILDKAAPASDTLVASSNLSTKPDLEVLTHLFGQLFTHGLQDPDALFARRALQTSDLSQTTAPKPRGMMLKNTMPRIHATPEITAFLQGLGVSGTAIKLPPADTPQPPQATGAFTPTGFPLVPNVMRHSDDLVDAQVAFSVLTDRFLQDHVLSGPVSEDPDLHGMSCVPLMVSLELMAETAAALLNRTDLGLVENLQSEGWVWADDDTTHLRVVATRTEPTTAVTEVFAHDRRVISATLTFGPCEPKALGLAPVTPGGHYTWDQPFEMYRENIFHGPVFQTIDQVAAWNTDGIEAILSDVTTDGFLRDGEEMPCVINPALFDAFSQISAFYMAEERGQFFASFPRLIERIEIYGAPAGPAEGLWLRAARTRAPVGGDDGTWAIDCFQNEDLIVRINGMQNAYSDVPQSYYPYSLEPINGWLGQPAQFDPETNSVVWDVPALPDEFWRRVGGVFHRVLAFSALTAQERQQWRTIRDDPTKREPFVLQRVAIKEALRWWLAKVKQTRVYACDIPVHNVDAGQWTAQVVIDGHVPVFQITALETGLRVIMTFQPSTAEQYQTQNSPTEQMEQQW